MTEQKITPCLWFDFNAEEAVAHYLVDLPEQPLMSTSRYGDFAPGRKGAVMTILFEIDGQTFPGAERRTAITSSRPRSR